MRSLINLVILGAVIWCGSQIWSFGKATIHTAERAMTQVAGVAK